MKVPAVKSVWQSRVSSFRAWVVETTDESVTFVRKVGPAIRPHPIVLGLATFLRLFAEVQK